jgi:hypothetical protein
VEEGGRVGQLISNKEGYYRNIWDENSKRYLSIFYFPRRRKIFNIFMLKSDIKSRN